MPRNRQNVTYWEPGRNEQHRVLEWQYDIKSRITDLSDFIGDYIPKPAHDLWDIAAACFAVDRKVVRHAQLGGAFGEHWPRSIAIQMEVRDQRFCRRVRPQIEQLLAWLTNDSWNLAFEEGEIAEGHQQGVLFTDMPPDSIAALNSGGLDSAAGLVHDLVAQEAPGIYAVSVATNPRMRSGQEDVLAAAIPKSRIPVKSIPFHTNLSHANDDPATASPQEENTQRSRGLLFLAAGVVAAITIGAKRLRVYENGVGAINLPATQGQIGAHAARPVHPRTIQLMTKIARQTATAAGRPPVTIQTPNLWRTKAELVATVPPEYEHVILRSNSCDAAFSYRSKSGAHDHCGWCTSCLLRRQALIKNKRALPTAVTSETQRRYPTRRQAPEKKQAHLPAMLWQVARLTNALGQADPWKALTEEFLDLFCVPMVLRPDTQKELLGLYQRYCEEWNDHDLGEAFGFLPTNLGL